MTFEFYTHQYVSTGPKDSRDITQDVLVNIAMPASILSSSYQTLRRQIKGEKGQRWSANSAETQTEGTRRL
jgi:hypothetical protein